MLLTALIKESERETDKKSSNLMCRYSTSESIQVTRKEERDKRRVFQRLQVKGMNN